VNFEKLCIQWLARRLEVGVACDSLLQRVTLFKVSFGHLTKSKEMFALYPKELRFCLFKRVAVFVACSFVFFFERDQLVTVLLCHLRKWRYDYMLDRNVALMICEFVVCWPQPDMKTGLETV
jgi:intergrase/recombinase